VTIGRASPPRTEVSAVPDLIEPPSARFPAEAVSLVSLAISDGDLGAALALYEPGAVFEPWAAGAAEVAAAHGLASSLVQLMELRLPLSVTVCDVVVSPDLTATARLPVGLVLAERRIHGTGPDCKPVDLRGLGATAVRQQRDGTWRIAADAWRLAETAHGQPAG
jgi:ketosteroid isomerase-like protein